MTAAMNELSDEVQGLAGDQLISIGNGNENLFVWFESMIHA